MHMEMLELLKTGMPPSPVQQGKSIAAQKDPAECIPCENDGSHKNKDDFFAPKPSDDDFFKM